MARMNHRSMAKRNPVGSMEGGQWLVRVILAHVVDVNVADGAPAHMFNIPILVSLSRALSERLYPRRRRHPGGMRNVARARLLLLLLLGVSIQFIVRAGYKPCALISWRSKYNIDSETHGSHSAPQSGS